MADDGVIRPPWTKEQVDGLNRFQAGGYWHPFTCPSDGCGKDLLATPSGWICPESDHEYRQYWAWHFMSVHSTPV